MKNNRTYSSVNKQIKGMGCQYFEVGVFNPDKGMLNRDWDSSKIKASLNWLKNQNLDGANIYIRPSREHDSQLVLLDDVSLSTIDLMKSNGDNPSVVVQTSPGNYQAWVKLDSNYPSKIRLEISKNLQKKYDSDPNSVDSFHYGRLSGFTNRKPQYVDEKGRYPYVLLDSYNGKVVDNTVELVEKAVGFLKQKQEVSLGIRNSIREKTSCIAGSDFDINVWYLDVWRGLKSNFGDDFNSSYADWMISTALLKKGFSYSDVRDAIIKLSPGIEDRKASHIDDYAVRTAAKASVWCDLESQGASYTDVKDQLLDMAKKKIANGELN